MKRLLLLSILWLVPTGFVDAGVITAHTEVVNSTPGQFVPLELDAPIIGYHNRLIWYEFPALITEQPLHFWRVDGNPGQGTDPLPEYGKVSFVVTQSGPVWMAVGTLFGGGGNPSGNWIPELTDRDGLIADGWSEIGTGMFILDIPTNVTTEYTIFERYSVAGESFTYRTEKYLAPMLLTTQFDVSSVPEPSGIWLLAIGLACLMFIPASRRISTSRRPAVAAAVRR